ncbi:hypothetical protein EDD86DRAFT_134144 [Gorgonomyces haynaldii]|nr:hypothetical protein EDD86DRAFT_134144 [Gorgonomyces haynaldii]
MEQSTIEKTWLQAEVQQLKEKVEFLTITEEDINANRNCKTVYGNPESRLWKPLKVGDMQLEHRVAMAPLTRMRATSPPGVPSEIAIEYYEQRASKGGLIVSEATFISKEAGGHINAPGIYTPEQIAAWKKITDAVHAKGGFIYCQLWALGRANIGEDPTIKTVSSSNLPHPMRPDGPIPEQMTIEDILRYIESYKHAAKCAIEAGFDGCELHGAHGYLLDQFLRLDINRTRHDKYSGSIENRARFMLDAVKAVADTIGETKTSIRISPFVPYSTEEMKALNGEPWEQWGYVCEKLKERFPKLAYVSITDPRVDETVLYSSDYFRAIFRGIDPQTVSKLQDGANTQFPEPNEEHPTVVLVAGGYTASDAEPTCDRTGDLVGFGRIFISNPDLPHRIRHGLVMNPYDRSTFYAPDARGYTDYPFADENTPKFVPISQRDPKPIFKSLVSQVDDARLAVSKLHKKIRELEQELKTEKEEKQKLEKTVEDLNKKLEQKPVDTLPAKIADMEIKQTQEQRGCCF